MKVLSLERRPEAESSFIFRFFFEAFHYHFFLVPDPRHEAATLLGQSLAEMALAVSSAWRVCR